MNRSKLDTLFLAYRSSGDAAALAQVFDLAAPELYELARRLSPDRGAAEDLLQDTFVAAIEKRASWDEREPLLPWLIGILAIASQRRRRERARTPDPERVTQTQVERPDEALAARELRTDLDATLAELNPEERSLVEQRLLEGRTPREMARERGLSATTLRMRLSRALARLRRAAPSSLSWALIPSWTTRNAVRAVRLRILPGAPLAGVAKSALTIAATAVGVLAVAGTIGILACLEPAGPGKIVANPRPPPTVRVQLPEPKVVTIGAPPAEGEIAAPAPAPDAPRKRLHLVATHAGKPLEGAELMRLFPDAGFEGYYPSTDALGRIDVDIVAQGPLDLAFEARACKRVYFSVDPAHMKDGEERTVALESGPLEVEVRFLADHVFPPGFGASFVSLAQLGEFRPAGFEVMGEFTKALNHPESRSVGIQPDGTTNTPIPPGKYWVMMQSGHGVVPAEPKLLPCCFELEVPELARLEVPYPGQVGGALVLDVVGPATIGMDVSVALDEGNGKVRKLWFMTYRDPRSAAYADAINVGTLGCRSEPIPPGEHTLVFTQRGKEIDRRKVTIVRGEELKLSISP